MNGKRTIARRLLYTSALVLLAPGVANTAHAGPYKVDITKTQDVTITFFNTFLTFQFGDPIQSFFLPAGNRLQTTIEGSFPGTDISTVETRATPSGLAPANLISNTDIGFVIPDPANPGRFTMPTLFPSLVAQPGLFNAINLPDLASNTSDVYTFVNLGTYLGSHVTPPPLGGVVTFSNGTSSSLPGVEVSTTPFGFDPTSGVVNTSPFTGSAFELGNFSIAVVPEPTSVVLLGLGLAGVLGFARYRQR